MVFRNRSPTTTGNTVWASRKSFKYLSDIIICLPEKTSKVWGRE